MPTFGDIFKHDFRENEAFNEQILLHTRRLQYCVWYCVIDKQ